ncbi:MAG: type II toxin-antitoxin system HipA family toxin [Mariprofundaceae bacterium]|nr:type II toxin-antitoxin system HipA family toxin [Mariprofundaceae bacterium]
MQEKVSYNVSLAGNTGNTAKVGEMVTTGDRCAFRYHKPFLESLGAFPIDPKNLAVKTRLHSTGSVLFGVFEDSLPDGWGRKLMAARYKLSHAEQSTHLLLRFLDEKSMGALRYELLGSGKTEVESDSINSIGMLAQAARDFEKGELSDEVMLQRLFNSAGSPGGAHPKASVYGKNGSLLLVKFPSINDRYDIVGLEASCLELAQMAGIQTPVFSVIEAGGIKMLCLDRFDRVGNGCRHMISMQSLLNVSGYYNSSYVQMADMVREVSSIPEQDLHTLFRQMIFNALIGNTDDHLKNFSMLFDNGYRLTPAYDILPNVNRNVGHTLSFLHNNIGPRRQEAVGSLARRFKINRKLAESMVDEIVDTVVTHWRAVCKNNGVPDEEVSSFYMQIEQQRKKLTD